MKKKNNSSVFSVIIVDHVTNNICVKNRFEKITETKVIQQRNLVHSVLC